MRLVIVHRFLFVAEALKPWLERQPEIEVAGMFHSGTEEAIAAVTRMTPDVVLVEAKTGGPALVRRLRTALPRARIVVLAATLEASEERAVVAAGADAYLQQDHNQPFLVRQILSA